MPHYQNSGLDLHYVSRGAPAAPSSNTLVFQHGIGGDVRQPGRFLVPQRTSISWDNLSVFHADFRAHGQSSLGPPHDLSIATLASDMVALLDHLGIERTIAGGISMGAAAALRMAVDHPRRCRALILCRPAWTDGMMSAEAREAYALIAKLLSACDWRSSAAMALEQSDILHLIEAACPDAAKSMRGQVQSVLNNPGTRIAAIERLTHLPASRALDEGLASVAVIQCPTLILAAEGDPIHPFEFAWQLSQSLPNCRLIRIAPKSASDDTTHLQEVDSLIGNFLKRIVTTAASEVIEELTAPSHCRELSAAPSYTPALSALPAISGQLRIQDHLEYCTTDASTGTG